MSDINVYIAEYVAVTAHCLSAQLGRPVRGNRYALDKPLVCRLLDRNKYEEAATKLRLWKALRWIDADEPHVTRHVRTKEANTLQRMIVIDLTVYEALTAFTGAKPASKSC